MKLIGFFFVHWFRELHKNLEEDSLMAHQLWIERRFVLQETAKMILDIEGLSTSGLELRKYVEEVHKRHSLFKEKMDGLVRDEFERCPDGPLLEIVCSVGIEGVGRLTQTCKRFRSLITSNKNLIWRNACHTWWRAHNPSEYSESALEVVYKYIERDWEWIARCFAGDEENSLLCAYVYGLRFGVMTDYEDGERASTGWGTYIVSNVCVHVGEYLNGRPHGRGTEIDIAEGVVNGMTGT